MCTQAGHPGWPSIKHDYLFIIKTMATGRCHRPGSTGGCAPRVPPSIFIIGILQNFFILLEI
jgi:hypothetical protein